MDKFKDYYKVLGVNRNASDEEIKTAYREAAKKYHPDKHQGEDQTKYAELFNAIQEAYEHLGGRKNDQKIKREYDTKWDAHYATQEAYEHLGGRKNDQKIKREYDAKCDAHYATKQQSTESTQQKARTHRAYSSSSAKQEFSQSTSGTYHGKYERQEQQTKEATTWDKFKQSWKEVRTDERKDPFVQRHARADRIIKSDDKKNRQKTTYFKDEYGNTCKGTYTKERTIPEEFLFQFKRGSLHVMFEMVTQLRKLGHVTEDTVPKFVIRNRKTLAGVMAACIIFGGASAHTGSQQNPDTISATLVDFSYCEDIIVSEEERMEAEKVNKAYTVYRTYTVDYGDTLSELAEEANCSVSEIQSKNGISNESMIQAGTDILIPYHIESGDLRYATYSAYYAPGTSLTDFADRYSTTVESIVKLNDEAIENGQVISNTLIVPNFATQKEIKEQKEIASAKTQTYSKHQ